GNYAKKYAITINGEEVAEHTTADGDRSEEAADIDTVNIAEQLYSDLANEGFNTGDWAIGRYHSTLYIRNVEEDFTISTVDGYSGRAMREVKEVVQRFADLPLYGPDGFVVRIAGTDATGFDDYWVEFQKN